MMDLRPRQPDRVAIARNLQLATAKALSFVVFSAAEHGGALLLALATDGADFHLALSPTSDLDEMQALTIRVARGFERAQHECTAALPRAHWIGQAVFDDWPDVTVATHTHTSLGQAAAAADDVAAASPTLFDYRCRQPDAFPRFLPDWQVSFHDSGPYMTVTGHRTSGPPARLWVRRGSHGYVGSVATVYSWWDPDQVREYASAELAARRSVERFEQRFGKPATDDADTLVDTSTIAAASLLRLQGGVHVLDVTLFAGLRQLLEVRPGGHASWAVGLHLADFTELRALETGDGPMRMDDPLWDVLKAARRAAFDFGGVDTAQYIADVRALAVLDYPTIAGAAQDVAPSLPLPTLREALVAMTWPEEPQPLEAFPDYYLRLLRRWLDPEQMHGDAYRGPGALELADALDAFLAERRDADSGASSGLA